MNVKGREVQFAKAPGSACKYQDFVNEDETAVRARNRPNLDRTQEVAGSSPASSMKSPQIGGSLAGRCP